MQITPIIGLTGAIGAGKDSVAAALAAHTGARVIAFADALRHEVAQAFGIDPRLLRQRHTKEQPTAALALARCLDGDFARTLDALLALQGLAGLDRAAARSPRWVMQQWGTQYRRSSSKGYWRRQLLDTVQSLAESDERAPIVITDVRFDDEASFVVDNLRGQLWRVLRPGLDSGASASAQAHESEAGLRRVSPHLSLINSRDLAHLHEQVQLAWATTQSTRKQAQAQAEATP